MALVRVARHKWERGWLVAAAAVLLATPHASAHIPSPVRAPVAIDQGSDLSVARRRKKRKKKRKKVEPEPAPAAPEKKPSPAPEAPPATPAAQLPEPPPLPTGKRTVAILPLEGIDVGEEILHSIEVALLSEVDETEGLEAVSPRDVLNDLGRFGLSLNCEGDLACLARGGRYARAHLSLETKVAALGGTISVSMRLVDTEKAREIGRVADPVSEVGNERAEELHRMAVQLLQPDTYIGSLTIHCSETAAEVYLDDKLVGVTPLSEPLANLRAGPHILRVTKDGFSDLYRFVDVVYNRSSTINVDLTNTTIAGTIVEEVSKTGFGALYVATDQDGVEIRLDGEPKATTPLDGAIEKIAAGKRRLSLRKEGFAPHSQEIEILAGQRVDLAVDIEGDALALLVHGAVEASAPLPTLDSMRTAALAPGATQKPKTKKMKAVLGWKFYTGLVLGGIAAGGFGASSGFGAETLRMNNRASEIVSQVEDAEDFTIDSETYNRLRNELEDLNKTGPLMMTFQYVSLISGALLAVVGGGLILWDLLFPTMVEEKETGPEPEPTPSTVEVNLGISPGPDGGFLVFDLRF